MNFLPSCRSMRFYGVIALWLSLWPVLSWSQAGVDLMGSPVPGITAIGHHAIGVNMSLLASERPFSERKWRDDFRVDTLDRKARKAHRKAQRLRFMSGFEGGLNVQTPLLDGTPLVDAFGSEIQWSLQDRRDIA
ncbi:MAG: hypothetical protein L7S67_01305, partial [Flavobacteriales bacterium]|nr:hypothetical protein [Flavobacteriales bacterium]